MSESNTSEASELPEVMFGDPPTVLPRGHHPIVESMFAPEAVWAMNRLRWHGYTAYLVGGAVRDLLVGTMPKDFDITTNARPFEISSIFHNCRIIGRRFRIAHIYFRDGQLLEISTFRSLPPKGSKPSSATAGGRSGGRGGRRGGGRGGPKDRQVTEDNDFGTPTEDAWRRDLTVNGLFYDSETGAVIDHVGGLVDLRDGIVRTIGPAKERFREDPVRMIRAIRHAARHRFSFAPKTWEAFTTCAADIRLCSSARLLEEFLRELRGPNVALTMRLALDSGLMKGWLSSLYRWIQSPPAAAGGVPNKRFGPWVEPSWGQPDAFWAQLLVVGEEVRKGVAVSDWVLLASFVLSRCWSAIYSRCRAGMTTRRLWRDVLDGPIRTFFREISLSGRDSERVRRLLQTYWRLHLYPVQPSLAQGLRGSPFLPEAIQLFSYELAAQNIPLPEWLEELRP